MNLLLIAGQVLVLLTWIFSNRNYKATAKQITKYKFSIQGVLINAWLILFIVQLLCSYIFDVEVGKNSSIQYAGITIYFLGVFLAIWSRLSLGKSWGLPMQHDISSQKELIIRGSYRISRNPIYLSELLMLIGFEIALQSWLIVLIVPFAIFNNMKAISEEKKLKDLFGNRYTEYMKKVPRFFGW